MKYRTQNVGRDAGTGRFMPVALARRRAATAVVQRVRIPVPAKKAKR